MICCTGNKNIKYATEGIQNKNNVNNPKEKKKKNARNTIMPMERERARDKQNGKTI